MLLYDDGANKSPTVEFGERTLVGAVGACSVQIVSRLPPASSPPSRRCRSTPYNADVLFVGDAIPRIQRPGR